MIVSGTGTSGLAIVILKQSEGDEYRGEIWAAQPIFKKALNTAQRNTVLRIALKPNSRQEKLTAAEMWALEPELLNHLIAFGITTVVTVGRTPYNLLTHRQGSEDRVTGAIIESNGRKIIPIPPPWAVHPLEQDYLAQLIRRGWGVSQGAKSSLNWSAFHTEPDQAALDGLRLIASRGLPVAVDIETAGVDILEVPITAMGLADKHTAVSVPWETYTAGRYGEVAPLSSYPLGAEIRDVILRILTGPQVKVLHNGQYDSIGLSQRGIHMGGKMEDTLLAHRLIYPNRAHNLQTATLGEFGLEPWKSNFKQAVGDFIENDHKVLRLYNAKDAAATIALWGALEPKLRLNVHEGPELYAQYIELSGVAAKMQVAGLRIEKSERDRMLVIVRARMEELRAEWTALAPDVNLGKTGSTPGIKKLFFETLGAPVLERSKKTDAPALPAMVLMEYMADPKLLPYARCLFRYKKNAKLLTAFLEPMETKDRINPTFKVWGTKGARWSSSGPNCFSGDTEVLTPHGWVRFDALPVGMEVSQYREGRLEFVKPTDYIEAEAQPLLNFSNEHIGLRVTPEHRMLLRGRKNKKFKVVPAHAYPEDAQQLHGALGGGVGLEISDNDIQWLVAVQADGHYDAAGGITLGFSRPRKIERMAQFVGLAVYAEGTAFRSNRTHRLTQLAKKYMPEKRFGPWVLELSAAQLQVFCDEIGHWDGCFTCGNMAYCSMHKVNVDYVQAAFTLLGKRAVLHQRPDTKAWDVYVTLSRDYSMTTNVVRTITAPEKAYCVTVPSSFLLVRLDGKTAITGNCQQVSKEKTVAYIDGLTEQVVPSMRPLLVADEGFVLLESDYSQLELRIVAHFSQMHEVLHWLDMDRQHPGEWDPHVMNARQMFRRPELTKKDPLRQVTKTLTYALFYNYYQGVDAVYKQLKPSMPALTLKQLQEIQKRFYAVRRELPIWQDSISREIQDRGYVEAPMYGRRQYQDPRQPDLNQALSFPIQSTAGDLANRSILEVSSQLDWAKGQHIKAQVHDALIVQARPEDVSRIAQIVKIAMERPVNLFGQEVVFPVDLKVGPSWGVMKELHL